VPDVRFAEQKVFSPSQSTLSGFCQFAVSLRNVRPTDELSKKSGSLRGGNWFTDLDNCLAGMQDLIY
jgi:hypothetical protein